MTFREKNPLIGKKKNQGYNEFFQTVKVILI